MKRVLIVDDDKIVLLVMENILKSLKLHVDHAADAHQAIRLLKTSQYDLVITDANMPSVSGFELLEILKNGQKNFGDLEVMMVSGRDTQKDAALARSLGVKHYLTKPVNAKKFKEVVSELLGLEFSEFDESSQANDNVRWNNAFKLIRVTENEVEFRSSVPLEIGQRLELGSRMLTAVSANFAHVEITETTKVAGQSYATTAKFVAVSEQEKLAMRDWITSFKKAG